MYQTAQNKLAAHLEKMNINDDDQINLYLLSFVATAFCLCVHLYILITFIVNRVTVMAIINAVSCAIYITLLILHRTRRYTIIAVSVSLEVAIYTTVICVLSGIDTYIAGYYLLVIILQIILPYTSLLRRFYMIFIISAIAVFGIIQGMNGKNLITFSSGLAAFLTWSNIFVLFFGTVIQLIIGDAVKKIIANINKMKIDNLSSQANTDPLTGLHNRRYAESLFTDAMKMSSAHKYCVAMLDIDDFKHVNDTWGHLCGDEVLVFLSKFLSENVRSTDMVFRWGGEEFLLILSSVDLSSAYRVLDNLREKLQHEVIRTKSQDVSITVTIGVAVFDYTSPLKSIQTCDDNLYIGKRREKNMVVAG